MTKTKIIKALLLVEIIETIHTVEPLMVDIIEVIIEVVIEVEIEDIIVDSFKVVVVVNIKDINMTIIISLGINSINSSISHRILSSGLDTSVIYAIKKVTICLHVQRSLPFKAGEIQDKDKGKTIRMGINIKMIDNIELELYIPPRPPRKTPMVI
jgi:hypothetical protein